MSDALKIIDAIPDAIKFLQWQARNSFEEAYRMAGGGDEWRDAWLQSKGRARLIANGVITGQEGYK